MKDLVSQRKKVFARPKPENSTILHFLKSQHCVPALRRSLYDCSGTPLLQGNSSCGFSLLRNLFLLGNFTVGSPVSDSFGGNLDAAGTSSGNPDEAAIFDGTKHSHQLNMLKEARKGFYVAILFVKRWKVTKKDV